MARPKKTTVDYFPHTCSHKTTVFILEQKYGNDGYAFWFKILEMLASTEGHYVDCNNIHKWEFLQAKTYLDENKCNEILDLLAKLDAIDKKLWTKRIVWCDNFIDGIADVYKNRRVDMPIKPSFYRRKPQQKGISTDRNPHSKLKETKLKETNRRFIKPSIKEIRQYCIERKNAVDPEQFFDFYESKGWMVGKNKMKDWKACVRTWEKNSKQSESKPEPITVSAAITLIQRNQTTSTMEEILKRLPEKDLPEFMSVVNKDNYLKGIYQRAKKILAKGK